MSANGILYWITGLSGAGKTTIGNRLYYELRKESRNVILLDGDILKGIVDETGGYGEADRRQRAKKYALLCKMLTDQGMIVICCTIAMYDEVRDWNRRENKGYVEVFLDVSDEVLWERNQKGMYSQYKKGEMRNLAGLDVPVELPKTPDLVIRNDGSLTIKECVERILAVDVSYSSDFDRDVDYWNQYYDSCPDIEMPSLFAQNVGKLVKRGKTLLELGCGNGRDSVYFVRMGLNVTAIDASDKSIHMLEEKYDDGNICFICDDFVCSPAIFSAQYDYCYSRFSLHAVNERQESEVIKNVYNSLKTGGQFFVEVRSVHDDLYGKGEKVADHSYIYEGHFRRFVVKEELEEKVKKAGFQIVSSKEQRGYAPFGESDPPVIRMILQKQG